MIRARICKRLRSPEIYYKESIPPAYVAWRAVTSNRVVVSARQTGNRFLGFLKGLQIRAQLGNRVVVKGEVFLHLPPPLSTAGIWRVFERSHERFSHLFRYLLHGFT